MPSGEQIEIVPGERRAVVVEVGGALSAQEVGDWAVLDGYDRSERCTAARGQSLIPWPNRLKEGAYRFEDRDYQRARVTRRTAGVALWLDDGYGYVMAFTGDSLPEPARRRRGPGRGADDLRPQRLSNRRRPAQPGAGGNVRQQLGDRV